MKSRQLSNKSEALLYFDFSISDLNEMTEIFYRIFVLAFYFHKSVFNQEESCLLQGDISIKKGGVSVLDLSFIAC